MRRRCIKKAAPTMAVAISASKMELGSGRATAFITCVVDGNVPKFSTVSAGDDGAMVGRSTAGTVDPPEPFVVGPPESETLSRRH